MDSLDIIKKSPKTTASVCQGITQNIDSIQALAPQKDVLIEIGVLKTSSTSTDVENQTDHHDKSPTDNLTVGDFAIKMTTQSLANETVSHDSEKNAYGDVANSDAVNIDNSSLKNSPKSEFSSVDLSSLNLDSNSTSVKSQHDLDLRIKFSERSSEAGNDVELLTTSSHAYNETPCLVCNHVEKDIDCNKANQDQYLCHLVVEHHLVIADVHLISDLQTYAIHWKNRFQQGSKEDFCSKILSNCGPKDVSGQEAYFLLCDALPEDRMIREKLQMMKLKQLLLRQEFERKDSNFTRACLFCQKNFVGNRITLFNHMASDHAFNVGHPDNIVNVREFLDLIESKLESLQCLLCENIFKDRMSLREHMRKKGHRKLNPKNKEYDKFYVINYLEFGKNWEDIQDQQSCEKDFDDWSGWEEDLQTEICFFCEQTDACSIYDHMCQNHSFDFPNICRQMQMSFYQQIKMINYIRKRTRQLREKSSSTNSTSFIDSIVKQVKEEIRNSTNWNQPQFYFPTIENDTLLYQLDENKGLFEPEDTYVISEDIDVHHVISNSCLTDLVINGVFDEELVAASFPQLTDQPKCFSFPPPSIF